MKQLLFASANAHKIAEIRQLLPQGYTVASLAEIGFTDDIPETAATIAGNAELKALFLAGKQPLDCFADDTGLVIPALNGEPGVFSARYAGPQKDAQANMQLVLTKLEKQTDRSAYFLTVIALQIQNELHLFEGKVEGHIVHQPRGTNGFGYDPIFQPSGHDRTFAEMSAAEKNALSHRGRALEKMIRFLENRP